MKITVAKQEERFRLMVQEPEVAPVYAGPRLERGIALPITQFAFDTREEATEAASKLQIYINAEHGKKNK